MYCLLAKEKDTKKRRNTDFVIGNKDFTIKK